MKLLIVIDMQHDFVDGCLGTPEAQAVLGPIAEKIRAFQAAGDPVLFTRDTHQENYLSTQEGKFLPVPHCIEGTPGWQIHRDLPTEGGILVNKPTFGSTALAHYISTLKSLEEIHLVGVCTDICVISNALMLKATVPEVPMFVHSSCCAGVTPESHENALKAMAACQIRIL